MELVDEGDDPALAVDDLAKDSLQPLLELPAVLRAGDHRADVQRDDPLALQTLGHVTGHDPLGEALDDRGLADAWLADQDGVVLRPAAEHLDDATHLLVATDHRVELAATGLLREVTAVLLEDLILLLGVLVGDALPAPDLGERREDAVAREARLAQEVGGRGVPAEQAEEQVLGRDVLVREGLGLAERGVEDRARGLRDPDLGALRVDLRHAVERRIDAVAERLRLHAEVVQ